MDKIEKRKKIIIIAISIVLSVLLIILMLNFNVVDFAKGKDTNISNDNNDKENSSNILYFDDNKQEKQYEYFCESDNCDKEVLGGNYYFLIDNASYIYNPVTKDKNKVNFDFSEIEEVVHNQNNEIYALIIRKDNLYEDENSYNYIYLIENNKIYLKENNYSNLNFIEYVSPSENDESKYINLNLITAQGKNNSFKVIDFINNKVLFDSNSLNLNLKNDFIADLTPVKINNDKYYYSLNIGYDKFSSYILNDSFKVITTHNSFGIAPQYDQGAQYSIYNNKIYVVNSGNTSFSIYDMNGKLIEKSKNYNYVYCVDKGYFLIKYDNNFAIIDSNEKLITKLDIKKREGQTISVNNNIITVSTIDFTCESTYKYNIKTKTFTEKNNKCDQ